MWADSDPDDTTYVAVIAASLRQAQTWRSQYEHAKTLAAQRGSPRGRRVLGSRQWSGKTLTEHRADRRAVVAQVLAAAGIDPGDGDQMAADQTLPDGTPRYVWADVEPGEVDYVAVIAASLRRCAKPTDGAPSTTTPSNWLHSAAHHAVGRWTVIRQRAGWREDRRRASWSGFCIGSRRWPGSWA